MEKVQKKRNAGKWNSWMIKIFTVQCIHFFMLAGHVIAIWLAWKSDLFPGEETIKSIVSSFAEILAGLYGITLAGYTFFLSRIDSLTASDTSLDYVVVNLKNRFKHLIYFITGHVIATLFITMVLMYASTPQGAFWQFVYRLFCNEFVLNTIFSMVLILYYSVRVVDPNCLEKEAKKLRNKLSSPEGAPGDTLEFLSLYGEIVTVCSSKLPSDVLKQLHGDKGNRFAYSIALLGQLKPEWAALLEEVSRVHHYYECVVNCAPMAVTQEMCLIARGILAQLKEEKSPEIP